MVKPTPAHLERVNQKVTYSTVKAENFTCLGCTNSGISIGIGAIYDGI